MKRSKLNLAILAALATSANVQAAEKEAVEEERGIQTMIITATKRAESIQSIPVSATAISGESMQKMGIDNFEEYVEFLPNVVFQGVGPGTNEVYIRGAATTQTQIAVSSVQALQPSVAFYLDEQPVSMQGRNLDVYAADIDRIEVLPGPQGTLFGASSQAGTIRMITNKPELDVFEAGFDTTAYTTKGGDMSYATQAFVNISPTDGLAVRMTVYNDFAGGWIDNIVNDPSNGGYGGSVQVIDRISNGAISGSLSGGTALSDLAIEAPNNALIAGSNQNQATYAGARLGLLYEFNEDWNLLLQHTEQTLTTEGVFSYDANLQGESSTNRFVPEANDDSFGLTTWTLNGRFAQLDFVYTGGYLDRKIQTTVDYTKYTNAGIFSAYYNCNYGGSIADADTFCVDPTEFYIEQTNTSRDTHEFRILTDVENALRLTTGVFIDEQHVSTVGQFQLANTDLPYFQNLGRTLAGNVGINTNGGPFGPDISFANDINHTISQVAVFGQVEYDLTDTVTASLGARYYDIEDEFKGATTTVDVSGRLSALGQGGQALIDFFGAAEAAAIEAAIAAGDLDTSLIDDNGVLNVDDTIFRATLDWHASDDVMFYTTWSEGFRPPVTNRVGAGAASNTTGAFANFRIPAYSLSDKLTNYELGMKSSWLDNTVRFNATLYHSKITDLQTSRFDPTNVSFLVFTDNVGDAEITGLDGDFIWQVSDSFTLSGAFSLLDTQLLNINPEIQGIAPPEGSRLPFSAEFSGNLQAEYYYEMDGELSGYIRGGFSYTGDRLSGMSMDAYVSEDVTNLVNGVGTGLSIQHESDTYAGATYLDRNGEVFAGGRYVQDAYMITNIAFGIDNDDQGWTAELFIRNLFDEHAALFIDTQYVTPTVVTNRPRQVGVKVSWDF
jgi:iron complex outermembrane receptor protein